MNNKLKIALKCTKYLLVAALVILPFIGPEKAAAVAEPPEAIYFYGFLPAENPNGNFSEKYTDYCFNVPGECPIP